MTVRHWATFGRLSVCLIAGYCAACRRSPPAEVTESLDGAFYLDDAAYVWAGHFDEREMPHLHRVGSKEREMIVCWVPSGDGGAVFWEWPNDAGRCP